MRGLINRLREWLADETGQMLVWVLIVTVTGSLIIGAFLAYASASLLTTASRSDQLLLYYTADAGAERCLVSLTVGAANCNNLTVSLNGYTATVTSTSPLTDVVPSDGSRYLATGLEGVTLTASTVYNWTLELNTRPVTVQVNWAFTPTTAPWELRLYRGQGMGSSLVTTTAGTTIPTGTGSPARARWESPILTDGVHTLFFAITPTVATVVSPFAATSDDTYTWVYANAYQDYIFTSTVTSTVGAKTILEVIARQTPGSSLITNQITVTVASWQLR